MAKATEQHAGAGADDLAEDGNRAWQIAAEPPISMITVTGGCCCSCYAAGLAGFCLF